MCLDKEGRGLRQPLVSRAALSTSRSFSLSPFCLSSFLLCSVLLLCWRGGSSRPPARRGGLHQVVTLNKEKSELEAELLPVQSANNSLKFRLIEAEKVGTSGGIFQTKSIRTMLDICMYMDLSLFIRLHSSTTFRRYCNDVRPAA